MSYNHYFPGSDSYEGHCPKCGKRSHTCYDELCESCFEDEPVRCPLCGDHYQPDQMEGSICRPCFEYERDEKRWIVEDWFSSSH